MIMYKHSFDTALNQKAISTIELLRNSDPYYKSLGISDANFFYPTNLSKGCYIAMTPKELSNWDNLVNDIIIGKVKTFNIQTICSKPSGDTKDDEVKMYQMHVTSEARTQIAKSANKVLELFKIMSDKSNDVKLLLSQCPVVRFSKLSQVRRSKDTTNSIKLFSVIIHGYMKA